MKIDEVINQLERLIDDREAFIRAYAPDRYVFARDKEALEEAVKVLKQYNRMVQVKAKPVKQRIKIQYEGEELTLKELVDRLEYFKESQEYLKWAVVEREKEIALLKKQLADAQAVRHGRWVFEDGEWRCSECRMPAVTENRGMQWLSRYCPCCGVEMEEEDDG